MDKDEKIAKLEAEVARLRQAHQKMHKRAKEAEARIEAAPRYLLPKVMQMFRAEEKGRRELERRFATAVRVADSRPAVSRWTVRAALDAGKSPYADHCFRQMSDALVKFALGKQEPVPWEKWT